MFATAKSVIESASRATQRRLRIHLLADEADGDEQMRRLEMLANCALTSGAMMRDVGVDRPVLTLLKFDSRRFPFRVGWSESKNSVLRNLTSPHNFARFYLAQYMAPSVRKIVWLDADVIVLDDVADLYDATLVDDDARELVFAACTTVRRFDFMIDMSPGSKILERKPALRKCYQSNCEHFNAGVSMLRLDRWRERNITAHIEQWIAYLNEHSDLVRACYANRIAPSRCVTEPLGVWSHATVAAVGVL
jgi:lipopolysaccharide biosynthesis glycosyltransferase